MANDENICQNSEVKRKMNEQKREIWQLNEVIIFDLIKCLCSLHAPDAEKKWKISIWTQRMIMTTNIIFQMTFTVLRNGDEWTTKRPTKERRTKKNELKFMSSIWWIKIRTKWPETMEKWNLHAVKFIVRSQEAASISKRTETMRCRWQTIYKTFLTKMNLWHCVIIRLPVWIKGVFFSAWKVKQGKKERQRTNVMFTNAYICDNAKCQRQPNNVRSLLKLNGMNVTLNFRCFFLLLLHFEWKIFHACVVIFIYWIAKRAYLWQRQFIITKNDTPKRSSSHSHTHANTGKWQRQWHTKREENDSLGVRFGEKKSMYKFLLFKFTDFRSIEHTHSKAQRIFIEEWFMFRKALNNFNAINSVKNVARHTVFNGTEAMRRQRRRKPFRFRIIDSLFKIITIFFCRFFLLLLHVARRLFDSLCRLPFNCKIC